MARKTSDDIQKEYNALVRKINRQLRQLEKHDPDTPTLGRWRGYFKMSTAKRPNKETITKMRNAAQELLDSGQLSVEGSERAIANAIQKLHDDGYEFIDRGNFDYFFKFIDDARSRELGRWYSSEQLLDVVKAAKSMGMSDETIMQNIAKWGGKIKFDKDGKIIENQRPPKPGLILRWWTRITNALKKRRR